MSKLKVDEIRSADRSVSSSANITLTDAGKVGIGVSSPDSLFEVAGTLGIKTQEPSLYFDRSGAYAWSIRNGDGSGNFPLSTLNVVNNGGTPTMTFKDDGNVGIGTTNPGTVLEVKSVSGVSCWGVFNTAGNNSAGVRFQREAAQKWWIYNNHGQSDRLQISDAADNNGFWLAQDSSTWTGFSDERMKKDWVIFSDALTKINKLTKIGEFRKINPITGEYVSDVTQRGLSAQEVEKILPEAITKSRRNIEIYPDDDTEYLGIAYQDVFVLAIKAIQELSAKVTALENK